MNVAELRLWKSEDNRQLTDEEMLEAVRDALDMLPAEFAKELTGVAVLVEDRHPTDDLMGIYDPTGACSGS